MKSVKYLEQIKAKHGLSNDRQLALHLKKSTGTISQYMNGTRVMDDEMCLAIAMDLGVNPIEIVGAACIDRAEKSGQKSLWEVFMTRMAATASALLFAFFVSFFVTHQNAEASSMKAYSNVAEGQSLYYVK
jgi:transcriptional regulator with XRE-family HTH domain